MIGDPSQEYFSDGLTEQIINGLCKVSNLFVISRNSSFAYKGKSISVKQIAKELGVGYILEGNVQRAGDRVPITAQLIDATTDYHMWSENYDRDLEDIFALQDEITMKLIGIMHVQLTFGKQAHSWEMRTNIHAFDKCMRGMEYLNKLTKRDVRHSREILDEAIKEGERAIELNSNGAEALALLAFTLTYVEEAKKAIRLMRRAFRLNPIPPVYYYAWMGMAYETDGQYENAIEQCKKAIDLNPYLYGSYFPLIYSYMQVNLIEKAKTYVNEFLKIAPKFSLSLFRFVEPFKSPKRAENYIDSLRKAGLPD